MLNSWNELKRGISWCWFDHASFKCCRDSPGDLLPQKSMDLEPASACALAGGEYMSGSPWTCVGHFVSVHDGAVPSERKSEEGTDQINAGRSGGTRTSLILLLALMS